MKHYRLLLVCLLLLLVSLLLVSGEVMAQSGDFDLSWNTLSPGGATGGGLYTMDSAIAQPLAGTSGASPYELCAGYLCGVRLESRLYLPVVRK